MLTKSQLDLRSASATKEGASASLADQKRVLPRVGWLLTRLVLPSFHILLTIALRETPHSTIILSSIGRRISPASTPPSPTAVSPVGD